MSLFLPVEPLIGVNTEGATKNHFHRRSQRSQRQSIQRCGALGSKSLIRLGATLCPGRVVRSRNACLRRAAQPIFTHRSGHPLLPAKALLSLQLAGDSRTPITVLVGFKSFLDFLLQFLKGRLSNVPMRARSRPGWGARRRKLLCASRAELPCGSADTPRKRPWRPALQ
jgi:hypothetical protein